MAAWSEAPRRRWTRPERTVRACGRRCMTLAGAAALQTALFPVEHLLWERILCPLLGVEL
jgi:hypothetical protein